MHYVKSNDLAEDYYMKDTHVFSAREAQTLAQIAARSGHLVVSKTGQSFNNHPTLRGI